MMIRGALVALLLAVGAALAYAGLTTEGSVALVRLALRNQPDLRAFTAGGVDGTLAQGLWFRAVEIPHLRQLPTGSRLKIETLHWTLGFPQFAAATVECQNGRVLLPHADYPVVFAGRARGAALDVELYAKSVGVEELLGMVPAPPTWLKGVKGSLDDVALTVQGPWRAPSVRGTLQVQQVSFRDFRLAQAPATVALQWRSAPRAARVDGVIVFRGGTVTAKQTAVVLEESRISFAARPAGVSLDIHGTTTIEGVAIRLALMGTLDQPDLRLTSDPPLSQEALLLMLATGQRWRGVEGQSSDGKIPLDLAKDFVDYVLFSGPATRFIEHFGMRGLSLAYDPATHGLTVTKSVGGRAEVHYGVEQAAPPEGAAPAPTATTHTVGAEVKITPEVSVEAEGEVTPQTQPVAPGEDAARRDGKVLLKYKKRF